MVDKLKITAENDEDPQEDNWYRQYQHQTVNLNNTIGMLVVSVLALSLLVAFLRQQKRWRKLAESLAEKLG